MKVAFEVKTSTVPHCACFSYNLGTWTGHVKPKAKAPVDVLTSWRLNCLQGWVVLLLTIPISRSHPSHNSHTGISKHSQPRAEAECFSPNTICEVRNAKGNGKPCSELSVKEC